MARIEAGSKVHDMLSILDAAESRKVSVPYNIFVYDVTQRAANQGFLVNNGDDECGGMGLSKLGIQVLKALNKGGFYDDKSESIGSADEMAGIQARLDRTNANKMIRGLIAGDGNYKYYEWTYAGDSVQDLVVLDLGALKALLKDAKAALPRHKKNLRNYRSSKLEIKRWTERVANTKRDIIRFEELV